MVVGRKPSFFCSGFLSPSEPCFMHTVAVLKIQMKNVTRGLVAHCSMRTQVLALGWLFVMDVPARSGAESEIRMEPNADIAKDDIRNFQYEVASSGAGLYPKSFLKLVKTIVNLSSSHWVWPKKKEEDRVRDTITDTMLYAASMPVIFERGSHFMTGSRGGYHCGSMNVVLSAMIGIQMEKESRKRIQTKVENLKDWGGGSWTRLATGAT
jgi:hypothetical protein